MTAQLRIVLKIGLITSAAIIVFWMLGQLTIYRYFRTEYYAAIVAVSFLATGIFISRINGKDNIAKTAESKSPLTGLTVKEQLILTRIAEGKSNKEIATENFTELSTVKTHINNIYAKLGVNSRKEAIEAYRSVAKP